VISTTQELAHEEGSEQMSAERISFFFLQWEWTYMLSGNGTAKGYSLFTIDAIKYDQFAFRVFR
jgi:hypothetical protein